MDVVDRRVFEDQCGVAFRWLTVRGDQCAVLGDDVASPEAPAVAAFMVECRFVPNRFVGAALPREDCVLRLDDLIGQVSDAIRRN
jgi:hypothetical protein